MNISGQIVNSHAATPCCVAVFFNRYGAIVRVITSQKGQDVRTAQGSFFSRTELAPLVTISLLSGLP